MNSPDTASGNFSATGLKVKLESNPTLDAIAERLGNTPPAWPKLYKKIRKMPPRTYLKPTHLRGLLADLHVDLVIRQAASSGELPGSVVLDPISHRTDTSTYRFLRGQFGNTYARHRSRDQIEGEYDSLFIAAGRLAVCETRITPIRTRGVKLDSGSYGVTMQTDYINKKLGPLQEYVEEKRNADSVGYIVVSTPDVVNVDAEREKQFIEQGGLVVAMPITIAEFDEAVVAFDPQLQETRGARRSRLGAEPVELRNSDLGDQLRRLFPD